MPDSWMDGLLAWLALPQFGLSSVFVVSFVSATLIPLGSEPVVYGMVKLRPDLFWATVGVATVGNTLGGMVDYWMGRGAEWMLERRLNLGPRGLPLVAGTAATATSGATATSEATATTGATATTANPETPATASTPASTGTAAPGQWHQRAVRWLERFGPFGCVLAWLPGIGDPLCAVAGWLRLPFWPCVAWMAIGKCLRYLTMTAGLVWMF